MITFFSFPRPFKPPFDLTQRNAILSWKKVCPECEIILFEDEEGTTKKVAEEFNVKYVNEVACNEFGTPLLDSIIRKARAASSFDILVCINPDIILLSSLTEAVKRAKEYYNDFLMVGRRWDLDVKEAIDFTSAGWKEGLRKDLSERGKLHRLSGMDYWVFTKNMDFNWPSFTNGRFATDGWMVYQAKKRGIPVIDATQVVDIVHENHYYPQKQKDYYEIERQRNIKLAGGLTHVLTLRDADWLLTKDGLKRPDLRRRILSGMSLFFPWMFLLSIKRKLQK